MPHFSSLSVLVSKLTDVVFMRAYFVIIISFLLFGGTIIILAPSFFSVFRSQAVERLDGSNLQTASQFSISEQDDPFLANPHTVSDGPLRKWQAKEPQLAVRSAIVYDLTYQKTLYAYNPFSQLPIASLAKLFTSFYALDYLDPVEEITFSQAAVNNYGQAGEFKDGEAFSVRDLITAALVASSNDAAYALAEAAGQRILQDNGQEQDGDAVNAFLTEINQRVEKEGLVNTTLADPTGLSPQTLSSVLDIISFAHKIMLERPFLFEISRLPETAISDVYKRKKHKLINTNTLLANLSVDIIGSKTGFTSKAQENMLIVEEYKGSKLIYVVLGAEDRNAAMSELIKWISQAYTW